MPFALLTIRARLTANRQVNTSSEAAESSMQSGFLMTSTVIAFSDTGEGSYFLRLLTSSPWTY
jgi:hypothetical protein